MLLAFAGLGLLAVGGVAVLVGVLPPDSVAAIAGEVWPILAFVVAITIVAELAAKAGLFDVAASLLASVARGRTLLLWLLVVVLAVVVTTFLSLDTTAVLLTPVVIGLARSHRLDPLPFVFTTVWLANTASLVLPVSNLTNLLAVARIDDGSVAAFVSLLGPSAAVAIIVSTLLLFLLHRRRLRGRHTEAPAPSISDPVQLRITAVVVVALLPLLASGMPPWVPASGAAALLLALFAWRSPRAVRPSLAPWPLLIFACGLFMAVAALEAAGSRAVLTAFAGTGGTLPDLLRLAGSGVLASNIGNNLPAFLALQPLGDTPERLAALLIGVNAGPLITPWASLATLLWYSRISAAGVEFSWRRFVAFGLVAVPVTVTCAVLPLALR
ncbi:ArsB/NhaD family transporter [Planococcus sp. APC 4015]|nr:ArsB/NhaD family transporter [Planococcus sp. APC 4015]